MWSSSPVEVDYWKYLRSRRFVGDLAEATLSLKEDLLRKFSHMFYSKCERRVSSVQKKDRPELEKCGWDVLKLAKTFKLPPPKNTLDRVDGTAITLKEFREKYEAPRIPCVLTGLTNHWNAHKNWTLQKLFKDYPNEYFKCGETKKGQPVFLKFKYFAEYMRENEDDSPLYIFDEFFGEEDETKQMLKDYDVPVFFQENLFDLLGNDEIRPPYRWIVIGPARSGTNIHVDPFGTSAWNALIHGHKRWVFIHPDAPREFMRIPKTQRNIHPKEAITWFSTVYKRICQGDWPFNRYPVYECRQNPGEIVFVPCGWWHVVINEDNTVAVTQNFCSTVNLPYVYPTIRKQRPSLARIFVERLNEKRPDLLQTVYESLLDPKPINEGYSSESDKEIIRRDEDSDSTTTTYSTDVSDDEGSGDRDKESEEKNDEKTEDEEDEEEDEEDDEDNEEEDEEEKLEQWQSRHEEAGKKSRFSNDTKKEYGFCQYGDSEDDSETYSDYDTDDDHDESEHSSISAEIRTKPAREISPIRVAPEGGMKRRAAGSTVHRLGIPAFLPSPSPNE